jgi:hypothetical protein
MHRLLCAGAGLSVAWSAGVAAASAHDLAAADATRLPSVEVTAPQLRSDVVRKPNDTSQPSPQSTRRAPGAPVPPAAGSTGATTGEATGQTGLAASSENSVSGAEVNARPLSRPAEALEVVPGLIATQHSGEGKANQYFLRGFNLDHGTDLAISVDGMPVNMRSHAHGQGYADLNFLIPELISSVHIRKGPYFADEGDFSSVGAVHINLLDSLRLASLTVGSFGYRRGLGITSTKAGEGTLMIAGEAGSYNGPWDNPDNLRKLNGVMRYSQGTASDGLSLTGMAYANRWNSTDQIPARAIASGEIGLYGALPSDGGNSSRFSLSGSWAQSEADGSSKANFYLIKSSLDLWNDFTYFLSDPVNGDQFHQHDARVLGGVNASHTFNGRFAGLPMETEIGVQSRYDDIRLDLGNTVQRRLLSPIRSDAVREGSVGVFAQHTLHWTDWLRSIAGWRGDFYDISVNSIFAPANSGAANAFIGSPKLGLVLGPFARTEFFVNAGEGFHSNDARGVTITESRLAGSLFAAAGKNARRRSRAAQQAGSGTNQRHQPVRAGFGFRDRVRRRRRRHYSEPAEPPHRHRMEQRFSAAVVARAGERHRHDACALSRRRSRTGHGLYLAGRISRLANRQWPRQFHSRRAEPDRLRRHQDRREHRMVRRPALPAFRAAPADGGRRLCLSGNRVAERAARLSVRQWLAHPARRLQFAQQQLRPDQLRLWLAAQIGLAVRDLLSVGGRADRARCSMPDRRDGSRAAPGRAARGPSHRGRAILNRSGRCAGDIRFQHRIHHAVGRRRYP